MTFATEAAKYGNRPLFVLEFTSGATTHRYSAADIAIKGVGFVEGRVSSFGGASRSCSTVCDNTGPDIAIIDDDGSVENTGIGNGWTLTVKVGFVDLAWASWLTFATYRVFGRPSRMSRILYFKTCGPGVFTLGRLSMPKIEASDVYLFTTLRVAADRVGEPLPFRFGSHGREAGAVDLVYLGINPSAGTLVWLVSAANITSAPLATSQIGDVFVDGARLEFGTFTTSVVATGNYQYLIVSLTIDQAGRLGILDDKSYHTFRLSRVAARLRSTTDGRRRGSPAPSAVESTSTSVAGSRPVRSMSANFVGPFGGPVTLLEELLQYHGSGLASRSSTSYGQAAAYVTQYALTVCGEISGDIELRQLADAICGELGLEQYYTGDGLHAFRWPLDLSYPDAADGVTSGVLLDDLHALVGEPSWHVLDGGDKAQVTAIDLTTPFGSQEIVDTTAVTTYGSFRIAMDRKYSICKTLSAAIAWNRIQSRKEPRTVMRSTTDLSVLTRTPGEYVRVSAHGGPALSGWSNRVCRLQRLSLDQTGCVASVEAEDRHPIESTLSAYMQPASLWTVATITVTWTASGRVGSTADAAAAGLAVGDIAYYQESAGTDRQLWARIQKIILSAGTYYIYVSDTLENPAGAISTTFLRQSLSTHPSAGRTTDDKRCTSQLHNYLTTAPVFAYGLNEQSSMSPGDTSYTSGVMIRQLRNNGSRTFSFDGQFGPVWALDGSTAFYDDPVSYADYLMTGAMTLVCWFETSSLASPLTLCYHGSAGAWSAEADNMAYWLYVQTTGGLYLYWESGAAGNGYFNAVAAGVAVNTRYFLTVSRAADGVCKFYLGTNDTTPALLSTSAATTMPTGGGDGVFQVGAARSAAYPLPGWVQGLLGYDSELSLSTIQTLWESSKRESCSLLV